MTGSFGIARVGVAEIRIHWSWVIMLALVTVFLGAEALPEEAQTTSPAVTWTIALATSLLGLASVVAHELAHVIVAQRNGLGGRSVTVQLLGGTYILETHPTSPGQQLRIAGAGPALSGGLGILFGLGAVLGRDASLPGAFWVPAVLLSSWNLFIALINLLPGYPLDGASMLRAVLWRVTHREDKATALTGRTGRMLGYLFVLIGFVIFFAGDRWTGIFLGIIGWLLAAGGVAVERREFLRGLVNGLRVRDAIEADTPRVPPQLTLDTFATEYLSEPGGAVLVERPGELLGIVGAAQARRIRGRNWPNLRAADVMTPIARVPRVALEAELWPVLEQLERAGLDALVVDTDDWDADARPGDAADAGNAASGEAESDQEPGITLVTRRSAARAVHARAQQRIQAAVVLGQVAGRLGIRQRTGLFGRRSKGVMPPETMPPIDRRSDQAAPPADTQSVESERPVDDSAAGVGSASDGRVDDCEPRGRPAAPPTVGENDDAGFPASDGERGTLPGRGDEAVAPDDDRNTQDGGDRPEGGDRPPG